MRVRRRWILVGAFAVLLAGMAYLALPARDPLDELGSLSVFNDTGGMVSDGLRPHYHREIDVSGSSDDVIAELLRLLNSRGGWSFVPFRRSSLGDYGVFYGKVRGLDCEIRVFRSYAGSGMQMGLDETRDATFAEAARVKAQTFFEDRFGARKRA